LCEVVAGTGVLELVDAAAAAVAPTEMAAGTNIGANAAPVVATVAAPAAWPPTTAPVAGACATVVDAVAGAAGTTVCATATPVAAMADNRITSLMTESPRK
jgi:hypothetical protein